MCANGNCGRCEHPQYIEGVGDGKVNTCCCVFIEEAVEPDHPRAPCACGYPTAPGHHGRYCCWSTNESDEPVTHAPQLRHAFDPGRDDEPCSNARCILGYAHDMPCITEGPLHEGVMALRQGDNDG